MEIGTGLTHVPPDPNTRHIQLILILGISNRYRIAAIAISLVHQRMILTASFWILSSLSICVLLSVRNVSVNFVTERTSPLYNRNIRCCSQWVVTIILINAWLLWVLRMMWLTYFLSHSSSQKGPLGISFGVCNLSTDTQSILAEGVEVWAMLLLRDNQVN